MKIETIPLNGFPIYCDFDHENETKDKPVYATVCFRAKFYMIAACDQHRKELIEVLE